MTDTDLDSQPERAGDDAERGAAPARTDMTIAEVRQWLRDWVAKATGRSRDAVAMAADIEDHTGVTVSIAAAFEHPTIESLASWIVEGDPFENSDDTDD